MPERFFTVVDTGGPEPEVAITIDTLVSIPEAYDLGMALIKTALRERQMGAMAQRRPVPESSTVGQVDAS